MLPEFVLLLMLGAQNQTCAAALEAAPQYAACARGRTGMALSATQDGADHLLAQAETAEPRFRHHFAGATPPYLVLYFEDDPPVSALRDAGFTTVLAWPSPAKLSQLMMAARRQNAPAQEGGETLSEEAEAALRLQTAAAVLAAQEMNQAGVLFHELGHTWYGAAFWRDSGVAADGYGTPAPDWLDETAAVLTEGDALSDNRRKLFREGWAAAQPGARSAPAAIGDLAHFLQRRHPSPAREATPSDSTADASRAVTVRARRSPGAKDAYYDQVRVFADYLMALTGDAAVFAEVSRALAAGADFAAWLGSQTRYPSLPRTIPDLQADWVSWIDSGTVTPRT